MMRSTRRVRNSSSVKGSEKKFNQTSWMKRNTIRIISKYYRSCLIQHSGSKDSWKIMMRKYVPMIFQNESRCFILK